MRRRTVVKVMTGEVVTVREDTPFAEIADALAEHQISAVPVLDDAGRVVDVVQDLSFDQDDTHPTPSPRA